MNHKDLLGMVFSEFENGLDMLNFSEISRRCYQIFQQNIKIEDMNITNEKQMKNIHGQLHGICRGWWANGKLWYKHNYLSGQKHGICRTWYINGKLAYKHNHYQNKKHGICRRWYKNGQLSCEHKYHHGKKHGICRGWHPDGRLEYEDNYLSSSQIEK